MLRKVGDMFFRSAPSPRLGCRMALDGTSDARLNHNAGFRVGSSPHGFPFPVWNRRRQGEALCQHQAQATAESVCSKASQEKLSPFLEFRLTTTFWGTDSPSLPERPAAATQAPRAPRKEFRLCSQQTTRLASQLPAVVLGQVAWILSAPVFSSVT